MTATIPNNEPPSKNGAAIHWPSLIMGLGIMIGVSVYPFALADKFGKVDHSSLMILMWAMSAGIIRGVGFVPKNIFLKYAFSAYAAFIALVVFLVITFT